MGMSEITAKGAHGSYMPAAAAVSLAGDFGHLEADRAVLAAAERSKVEKAVTAIDYDCEKSLQEY